MDSSYAIESFLRQVDHFPQVVFVDYGLIQQLFGKEVSDALHRMEAFAARERVCDDCGGLCCQDVGCELYAPHFTICPIHRVRPIVCRFHFCHKFDVFDKPAVLQLRDIFLGCYMALDNWGHDNLRALDIPPLSTVVPEFTHRITPWVEEARDRQADPDEVARMVYAQAVDVLETGMRTRNGLTRQ